MEPVNRGKRGQLNPACELGARRRAIEAADVVLMDDRLSKLPVAIRVARKTLSIVRQNIVFALFVKALVLVLGAMGIAGLWEAVFADVGVSVLAILNAMRAMRQK